MSKKKEIDMFKEKREDLLLVRDFTKQAYNKSGDTMLPLETIGLYQDIIDEINKKIGEYTMTA